MNKSTLFGMAAFGMAVAGASNAFATPTLTLTADVSGTPTTLTLVSAGSGNYYSLPDTLGGFSWGMITANVQNPNSNNGTYQLSLAVGTIQQSPAATATLTFVATGTGFGPLPVNTGIGSIQGSVTNSVTNGTINESTSSNGTLNPSPGTQTGSLNFTYTNTPNLQTYQATGPIVSTNASLNEGAFTLQTTDAIIFLPGNLSTSIANISSVITATPVAVVSPEPASLALLALAGTGLLLLRRKRVGRVEN